MDWTKGLTQEEIIQLAGRLVSSTNHVLNVAREIEWKLEGGWDGFHDLADIARDNRALLENLEFAYARAAY